MYPSGTWSTAGSRRPRAGCGWRAGPHRDSGRESAIDRAGIISAEKLRAASGPLADAVVVDARGRRAYAEGHIPCALRMGWEDWCAPAPEHAGPALAQKGYWGVLATLSEPELRERLEGLGLSSDCPVVVYGDGPRTRGREGRIAWMLLYFGARDVALLDGGWSAWRASGGGVSTETPELPRGRFETQRDPWRRRTLEELKVAYAGGSLLPIDTRSQAEFAGERDEYLPRRGRLPGAVLVPFADLFDDGDRYCPPPAVSGEGQRVAYCEVGVRAGLYAVLQEAHTGEVVPVYDGSIMEWSLHPNLPMESG